MTKQDLTRRINDGNARIRHIHTTRSNLASDSQNHAGQVNGAIESMLDALSRGLGCQATMNRIRGNAQAAREAPMSGRLGEADHAMLLEIRQTENRVAEWTEQRSRL